MEQVLRHNNPISIRVRDLNCFDLHEFEVNSFSRWIFAIEFNAFDDSSEFSRWLHLKTGHFHLKDIERIKIKDIWLQRFLEQQDLNMNDALEMLWETCKWRKSFGANGNFTSRLNLMRSIVERSVPQTSMSKTSTWIMWMPV